MTLHNVITLESRGEMIDNKEMKECKETENRGKQYIMKIYIMIIDAIKG